MTEQTNPRDMKFLDYPPSIRREALAVAADLEKIDDDVVTAIAAAILHERKRVDDLINGFYRHQFGNFLLLMRG
ncbi:hypothetical protein [Brucella sp. 2280]|uniref:hypothetical protein n=1 Tax=Brucella sp. 2280 TaxID=2592625 RepID=UPI00129784EB|nr:hypothetical protein [Brucella sp. 2280]QGA56885.1 hypothetical protein GHC20_07270 [Brucella sp. 2280]